jgi:hypothetical protein
MAGISSIILCNLEHSSIKGRVNPCKNLNHLQRLSYFGTGNAKSIRSISS